MNRAWWWYWMVAIATYAQIASGETSIELRGKTIFVMEHPSEEIQQLESSNSYVYFWAIPIHMSGLASAPHLPDYRILPQSENIDIAVTDPEVEKLIDIERKGGMAVPKYQVEWSPEVLESYQEITTWFRNLERSVRAYSHMSEKDIINLFAEFQEICCKERAYSPKNILVAILAVIRHYHPTAQIDQIWKAALDSGVNDTLLHRIHQETPRYRKQADDFEQWKLQRYQWLTRHSLAPADNEGSLTDGESVETWEYNYSEETTMVFGRFHWPTEPFGQPHILDSAANQFD